MITCTRRLASLALVPVIIASARPEPVEAEGSESVTLEACIVLGAPGESTFAEGFTQAASAWQAAVVRGGGASITIGAEAPSARATLRDWIAARADAKGAPLWLVYLGHGTFDGRDARLNLPGPDVTARELAQWLEPVRRPVVFVHGGSASAPFLTALSRPGRVIVTATRSGQELNYARFGEYFAGAIATDVADIDRDGQTSLLEAFVTAAQRVQAFYAEQGRLATEHALLDDNGDGHGTPAEWFRGTRLQRAPEAGRAADGDQARLLALIPPQGAPVLTPEQRTHRDALEQELLTLRNRKDELPPDRYDLELERILRRLAPLYREEGAAEALP